LSINATGQVAGYYQDSNGQHGFIYSDGNYTILNVPGALNTQPLGMNGKGQVVGIYNPPGDNSGFHGFLYSGGTYTILNVPGAADTSPVSINGSGQVVGSYTPNGENNGAHNQGFVYSNGTYTTLTFPGAINTDPYSINAKGQVVGYYEVADSNGSIIAEHGFLYSNGICTTIDPPGGIGPAAASINNSGQIVGNADINGTENGFLATQTYAGKGHPTSPLTVTASNTTAGESSTVPAGTISGTDPPVTTTPSHQSLALLNQFVAAGLHEQNGIPIVANSRTEINSGGEAFLTQPHH
jgi:probable HAF family extracellular repeat protein